MSASHGWHSRGYLPHYDDSHAMQVITYHLADSLPLRALEALKEQTMDNAERRAKIECHLDAGYGSCALRERANAEAVLDVCTHAHGSEYYLHAWVIMPNHVHVLIEPLNGSSIGRIVSAWKSVSARRILRLVAGTATALGRIPPIATTNDRSRTTRHVWQLDYHDRFIRNESHYHSAVDYIHKNPVRAGLVAKAEDWVWSSASVWDRDRPRSPTAIWRP